MFDPSLVPSLSAAADTSVRVVEVRTPAKGDFSVSEPGSPRTPAVVLELGGNAPRGAVLSL